MSFAWNGFNYLAQSRVLLRKRNVARGKPYPDYPEVPPKGTTGYQKFKIWRYNRFKQPGHLRLKVLAWFLAFAGVMAIIFLAL